MANLTAQVATSSRTLVKHRFCTCYSQNNYHARHPSSCAKGKDRQLMITESLRWYANTTQQGDIDEHTEEPDFRLLSESLASYSSSNCTSKSVAGYPHQCSVLSSRQIGAVDIAGSESVNEMKEMISDFNTVLNRYLTSVAVSLSTSQ